MTDVSLEQNARPARSALGSDMARSLAVLIPGVVAIFITFVLAAVFQNTTLESPLLLDSTVGELAVWMADQSTEEAPESLLGQYAKNWALQVGAEDGLDDSALLLTMRNVLAVWCILVGLLAIVGLLGAIAHARWTWLVLLMSLLGLNALLFIIPTIEGDNTLALVLVGIILMAITLIFAARMATRVVSFFIALSALLVLWEVVKGFAAANVYDITLPAGGWNTQTYESLDTALTALENGDVNVVLADRNELEDVTHPDLAVLTNLDAESSLLPVKPNFPGRLAVAVRADNVAQFTNVGHILSQNVGAVAGGFAETDYLAVPRETVLVDLKIFNDLNLPHLQNIAEAFMQPARRNGPLLLIRILAEAGLYTWGEALFGFALGASLGFLLGTLFAHSPLMSRGLLPYVVASQTVPILAIAPIVVIWIQDKQLAVSVIASYLTFFPVTINTMRGLQSPQPTALELMQSYAASKWDIMWKLRFPSALPYIFTALKVSATASVVGAIIGELPSSIRSGLGRAILDFSSDYSLISTPKLWASIIMAAAVGIVFFVIVSIIERVVLRGYVRES